MIESARPVLSYRVLDVNGNEIIRDLPHLHQSTWEVNGFQIGLAGEAAPGRFTIPLFPPQSQEYLAATADYSKLAPFQRIEGYYGVVNGTPSLSGVITGLVRTLNGYSIVGYDSIYWLTGQRCTRSDWYPMASTGLNLHGSDLAQDIGLKRWAYNYSDSTMAAGLAPYTTTGGWSGGVANEGVNCLSAVSPGAGSGLIRTTANFAASNWTDFVVEAFFHVKAAEYLTAASGPVVLGECAVVANTSGDYTGVVGSAKIFQTRDSVPNRTVVVGTLETGNGTAYSVVQTSPSVLFTLADNAGSTANGGIGSGNQEWRCQVQLVGKFYASINRTFFRLIVNGIDAGIQTAIIGPLSGGAGLRYNLNSGVGSPFLYAYQFDQRSRKGAFVAGSVTGGVQAVNQVFNRASALQVLNQAAQLEGYQWRKNAKAGLWQDTIDFGTLGADYSSQVVYEEGVNLGADSHLDINAESFGTALQGTAGSSGDQGGAFEWANYASVASYGYFSDSGSLGSAQDFLTGRKLAQAISSVKSAPSTAKTFALAYDPTYAAAGGSPTSMVFRELDYITTNSPSLGLFRQKVQIMTATISEVAPFLMVTADQYPVTGTDSRYSIKRLIELTEAANLGSQGVTVTANGLLTDALAGSPHADTVYLGQQSCAASGSVSFYPLAAAGMAAIQKVAISVYTDLGAGMHLTVNGTDVTVSSNGPWSAPFYVDITKWWANGQNTVTVSSTAACIVAPTLHVYGLSRFI